MVIGIAQHDFDNARKKRSLTEFLGYAVQGLVDGLSEAWDKVRQHTFSMCWREHVFQTFSTYTDYHKIAIFKRRRELALSMPIDRIFTLMELARSSDKLAAAYLQKGNAIPFPPRRTIGCYGTERSEYDRRRTFVDDLQAEDHRRIGWHRRR